MIDTITLLNQSSDPQADTMLVKIAEAINDQIKYHVAPAWQRLPMKVVSGVAPGRGIFPIYLFDNADVAGALGYHDETPGGLPYGRIFHNVIMQNGGTWLDGNVSISAVFSHEAVELFGDVDVNEYRSNLNGTLYAVELADAVEGDSYTITINDGTAVAVSNFIYPTWFNAHGKFRSFDHMGTLSAPFTMSRGGYVIVERENQPQQQFSDEYPEWRKAMKEAPASRTYKRMHQ